MKIAVIGTGLFGSVQARHLIELGHQVITIDNKDIRAGSGAAACLIKPSWLASMETYQIDASFSLLDKYYGLQDIQFVVNGVTKSTVRWVNPSSILKGSDLYGKVLNVTPYAAQRGYELVVLEQGSREPHRLFVDCVVVAAGFWTFELLQLANEKMVGQAGCAHLYKGQLEQPFIKIWAPYKQLVGFNRDEENVWVGDGAAIKFENWSDTHRHNNFNRCYDAVPKDIKHSKSMFGIRPYVKDAKPCYIKELSPSLWAVTGGAKNGTIAAGWAAHFVGKNLK